MDKRYQVFVSSTYVDLIEERKVVFQTLMEMDCIPAGMELFPAADEEQFQFIKRVIDDCDYYLLIIGGRYGSLAEDQISYTEKEFDYAVEQGKKVVVLVHKDPNQIPSGKSESSPKLRRKLDHFKSKAMAGRLVDFWEEAKDLRGLVAVSLNKTIKMFPAQGWVRGDKVLTPEIMTELHELRSANILLRARIDQSDLKNEMDVSDIVDIDSSFDVEISNYVSKWSNQLPVVTKISLSWRELFHLMAIKLYDFPRKSRLHETLSDALSTRGDFQKEVFQDIGEIYFYKIDNFDIILAQLQGYGLIATEYVTTQNGETNLHVKLLERGNAEYLEGLIVRKKR